MSSWAGPDDVVVRLAGGRRGPAQARAVVRAYMRNGTPSPRLDELLLLTSEVVANAVVHGGAGEDRQIELRLEQRDRMLHVLVTDPGVGHMPEVQARDDLEPGGLGLVLLDALSERWGVVRHAPTKDVWFDFETAACTA